MLPYLLPHLISRQAQIRNDAVALQGEERAYTYGDLDGLSDGLAATLRERGIGHHDRVGLMTTRSDQSYISIFGVLKAGGTYVPMDCWAPMARLMHIAHDCQVSAIVVEAQNLTDLLESSLPPSLKLVVVIGGSSQENPKDAALEILDWDAATTAKQPPPNPALEDDLAAILYTSGSTGVPKGVMLSHRNIMTFALWASEAFALEPSDRVAGITEFHFDLSTFDIFATFASGATLVPTAAKASFRPAALARWISAERISVWYSTPSLLILLLTRGELASADLSSLRVILFAGEVFALKHLRTLRDLVPKTTLANLYGPTETNVCTWHCVDEVPDDELPIGKPCPNTEVSIRDLDGNRVAPGEKGELWVRGPLVMQGYWGNSEKTRQNLVWDVEAVPWERKWYRTGDIVHYNEAGELLYRGRVDHMVKIRGYRVELGEVEAVIYNHPDIKESAVIAKKGSEGESMLCAFVVAEPQGRPSTFDIKKHIGKQLPQYMVPATIRFVDELPKTSGGKVDRKKLEEWPSS